MKDKDRILFIDCAGSKLIEQINNFYRINYPGVFSANLRMMGTIYPFLINDDFCFINEKIKYVRNLITFEDQAKELIYKQELNKVIVVSEPECLRYNQLLECGIINDYGSQEEAFQAALSCFKVFLKNWSMNPEISNNIFAWYIDPYDDPNKLDFRQILIP